MTTAIERLRSEVRRHAEAAKSVQTRLDAGEDVTEDDIAIARQHVKAGFAARARLEQAITDGHVCDAAASLSKGVGLATDDEQSTQVTPRVKALGGSTWASTIIRRNSDQSGRFKALLPSGQVPVTVPIEPEPVRASEPVLSLRQLIPTIPDTVGRWSYFRQTLRDNNAAVVAPGARKPVSPFALERVEDRARTIAHLSEALHRNDLDDAPSLRAFVDTELRLGLEIALEDEIVNGDGSGEHFVGLAGASGHQVQAWAGDLFTTTRQAVTKLEALGLTGTGFVFSPRDWERIELAGNDLGYALAQAGQTVPVDRAARRLWGVPVAVSTTVTVGTGWLVDFTGSTELHLREEARVDWSEHLYSPDLFGTGQAGNLFEGNMIQFRCEMRAGFSIKRPAGVVALDLTA